MTNNQYTLKIRKKSIVNKTVCFMFLATKCSPPVDTLSPKSIMVHHLSVHHNWLGMVEILLKRP